MKRNDCGTVEFHGMQHVSMLFRSRPSFSELVVRLRERLKWTANEADIVIEGVIDVGSKGPRIKRLVSIGGQDEWENYVSVVMETEVRALDLFVRKVLRDPSSHGMSLYMNDSARVQILASNQGVKEVADVPIVGSVPLQLPLSQSDDDLSNDDGGDRFVGGFDDGKDLNNVYEGLVDDIAPVEPLVHVQEVCRTSNNVDVQIMDDGESYQDARAVDSDDDRQVGELTASDIELIRRLFPSHDPVVADYNDLSQAHKARAHGREDGLVDVPNPGASTIIKKGLVFKNMSALKTWLREYAIVHNRPYKVKNSDAQRRYTIKCEKEGCDWSLCARKVKDSEKFRITRVIGPHTCSSAELDEKHRQLNSKFIAACILPLVKQAPTMRVKAVITTVNMLWGFNIQYGKAWMAKQRALKMIYGDWEEAYERLPALLNAIKAVNLGMHYEYVPKPNEWKDGKQIFHRAFWCFGQCVEAFKHCRPVLSIDSTFLLGKYQGTMWIAIGVDADNCLVPLAFALAEKENKDSWAWFLRLVQNHVIGPGREVCVISDRHAGNLSAVQMHVPGHAPVHHRWCTRHLAENLLKKDGSKDNFPLFEEVCQQLEVKYFEEKLNELKSKVNAEGRDWLRSLMPDVEKWTRAHDKDGRRYEFQTSNMVEALNGLLKGIRGLPVTAIVAFTFYKCAAWFKDRHAEATQLEINHKVWAPTPQLFLDKAKGMTSSEEYHCVDHATGTYEIVEHRGTTHDGGLLESRKHKVVIRDFSCTCRGPDQYHFPCSHYVTACRAHNLDVQTKIPKEFSVHNLIRTWTPRFEPYPNEEEWPPYLGPRFIVDPESHWNKYGSRRRLRYKLDMDAIPGCTRRSKGNPFLADPEQNECSKCGRLRHNARTCVRHPIQV